MKTVHSIAADVARHLERPGVLNKISRLHNLLHSWMKKSEDFDGHGFRLRPETTLGVNTSSIEKGQWIVDLKLYGVVYGHVDFSSPGEPRFTLKKVNAKKVAAHIDTIAKSDAAIAHLRTGSLDWRNPAVRRYIRAARSLASGTFDGGEAAIQAALITQMRHGLKGKPHALHYHQPVTFQGIPIQLPCPVAPLGEKADGENWGHMDVLARHGRGMNAGQLRVFELKQPRAKDALDALEQSIHYAAALRCLLEPEDTRSLFLNVLQLGRTQPPIKITAVAFVHESAKAADLQDRINHLNEANTGIGVRALRYRWDPNVAPPKRLLVVDELCPKP